MYESTRFTSTLVVYIVDDYDPDFICNGSDDGGRYAFNKQPEICRWNLEKLAEALDFVLPKALV